MSKHTPGPWYLFNENGTIQVSDSVAHKSDNAIVHWMGFDCSDKAKRTRLANARLIAAAPDLLEACQAIAAWDKAEKSACAYEEDGGAGWRARLAACAEAFEKAHAAIAKATGA